MAVADGELLGQVIIKGNVGLIIEADGLIFGGSFHAIVDLLGAVVHAHEAVHEALAEGVAWICVVGFPMGGEPRVIEVRSGATAGLMEGEDLGTVVVEVGIETVESAGGVELAGETVDARMVIEGAAISSGRRMIRGECGIG